MPWSDPSSRSDSYWLSWLESCPWGETCFVDGNHENHDLLDSLPVETWHGGNVHRLHGHPSIIHLMRGEVYHVDDAIWWCFGGAKSQDRQWRVEGESWWPREMPSDEEMDHGLATLAAIGDAPDYVFTHDCPTHLVRSALTLRSFVAYGYSPLGNFLTDYLDKVDRRLDWARTKRWYCGHYHRDVPLDQDSRHILLYQRVIPLGEGVER